MFWKHQMNEVAYWIKQPYCDPFLFNRTSGDYGTPSNLRSSDVSSGERFLLCFCGKNPVLLAWDESGQCSKGIRGPNTCKAQALEPLKPHASTQQIVRNYMKVEIRKNQAGDFDSKRMVALGEVMTSRSTRR